MNEVLEMLSLVSTILLALSGAAMFTALTFLVVQEYRKGDK